jgi:hypothetical protein
MDNSVLESSLNNFINNYQNNFNSINYDLTDGSFQFPSASSIVPFFSETNALEALQKLQTFSTSPSSHTSAYTVQMVANNISPEKESAEESDLSDDSSSMDNNEKHVNNEIDKKTTSTPNTKKGKKRKIEKTFIKDPNKRASVKYLRKKGIIKKLKLFDILTGSKSAFLSYCNKNTFSSYLPLESPFQALMPAIEKLIDNKTELKNKYAFCSLADEGKNIREASQRILNSKPTEKIIYAKCAIAASKSMDFTESISSDDEKHHNQNKNCRTIKKKRIKNV